jgi:sialidase-1
MKSPLILLLMLVAGFVFAAEPFLEKQDLFLPSQDPAYSLYRIPGVVVTAKGTVLAWCEARKGGGDWADIRLLVRRSTDEGRTWDPPRKVAEVPGLIRRSPVAPKSKDPSKTEITYNNPVFIADRDGSVHMLFCLEYERAFHQVSRDDGLSWSEPVEITPVFEAFRKDIGWKVLATGPGHAIQLRTGRLIVPVWLSSSGAHRPSVTATIFSDDHGATWQAGQVAVPNTSETVNPNETVAVELADGRVLLNVRSESGANRRIVTTSPDGATGWTRPEFDPALLDPICMAAMARYQHHGQSLLLFSNPDTLDARRPGAEPKPGESRARKNLSVKISRDEGRTWPVNKLLQPGPSAYSDLAVTRSGTILCFYERESSLTLARFNLDWLESPDLKP